MNDSAMHLVTRAHRAQLLADAPPLITDEPTVPPSGKSCDDVIHTVDRIGPVLLLAVAALSVIVSGAVWLFV